MHKDEVVEGVSKEIMWWMDRRVKKLESLEHGAMAVNPFLMPLIMALGDLNSFDELAEFLLAGHFCIGHATGFGKLIDEKILPKVFNTVKLDAAFRKRKPFNTPCFDEIDHIVRRSNGDTCLLCLKAGRWTIQLTMAVQLNSAFRELIAARTKDMIDFSKIVVGVFYGTEAGLTDKYDILRGINRGAVHSVVDITGDVEVYAGRAFWSWLNEGEDETQEWLMEGILLGYENAIRELGSVTRLLEEYKGSFASQYQEFVDERGNIDWQGILRKING